MCKSLNTEIRTYMQTEIARLTIDLPVALHRVLKAHAALNDSNVKEFVIEAIQTRLERECDRGHELNAQTKEILRKSRAGKEKRTRYDSVEDLMKSLRLKKK